MAFGSAASHESTSQTGHGWKRVNQSSENDTFRVHNAHLAQPLPDHLAEPARHHLDRIATKPMPELNTPIIGTIVKSIDLPEDVVKAVAGQDVDHWFYATVEKGDLQGDVVRVKGMRMAENVPFIVSHKLKPNEDGTLPVIGKTVGWHRTSHKSLGVPAMVTGVKFAPNKLGQEYKDMYDKGFLTDVSVGMRSLNGKAIQGGRYDIEDCEVFELSACIKGVNPYTSIIKAMLGSEDEARAESILDRLDKAIDQRINQFTKTLDDIECERVAKAHDPEQPSDHTSQTHEVDAEALSQFAALAKSLAERLNHTAK